MLKSVFFHPLTWDNDMYIVYVVWVLLALVFCWLMRFVHKIVRRKNMKYKGGDCYLCRDIFMRLNGFEYLVALSVVFAIYMGVWAYVVSPAHADWGAWGTYWVLLPQALFLISIIVAFFWRYVNFRKPYIK